MSLKEILWSKSLSVGHPEIDNDHHHLIELLNKLAPEKARQSRKMLQGILHELGTYAVEHFAREEKLMQGLRFPLINDHMKLHRAFERQVGTWQDAVAHRFWPWLGGTIYIGVAEWLVRHILDEDLRVGIFVRTGQVPEKPERRPLGETIKTIDGLIESMAHTRGFDLEAACRKNSLHLRGGMASGRHPMPSRIAGGRTLSRP